MSTPAPITLLVLCAAAVVGAISWWLFPSSASNDAESAQLESVDDARQPVNLPLTPDAAVSGRPWQVPPLDGHGGLADDELFAHLSDLSNSDLPPAASSRRAAAAACSATLV